MRGLCSRVARVLQKLTPARRRVWVLSLVVIGAIALLHPAPAQALDYNRENLVDADFADRDLTDSSFTKANLRNANLSHTQLQGVSFFAANLESANLEAANLAYATLDSARLVEANLTNAVLEGAFAFNARFEGATIDGADFTDVLLRQDMQDKLCAVAQGTNPTTGRATRDTLNCF
ncbi:MAG: pentapeptide repeat-containing protein [Cyanobacteria bacterium J069]|nr:MAG: pentapeptide repeat-containing protein [Cyanobacteria bacterium J069]